MSRRDLGYIGWQASAYDSHESVWDGETFDTRLAAEVCAFEWYAQGFRVVVRAPQDRSVVMEMTPAVVADADDVLAQRNAARDTGG